MSNDDSNDEINLIDNKDEFTSTTSTANFSINQSQSNLNKLKSIYINKEIKHVLLSLSTILVYYCFSICLTFYNRYLFVTYKYPLSITIIHLIVKFILSTLIRSILNLISYLKKRNNHKKRIDLDWFTYLTRIIPTGVASAADIGLSNWSLQYITVTLYTMSKSTVILFIFFFSILFKLEKWRRSIIAVVVCIAFGLFLFTYHSTEFHLFGFSLIMIASFTAGLRWTLAQAITQKHELGLSNPIDMIYHIQPCMIICLLPLAVYVEGLSILTTDKFFRSDDYYNTGSNLFWILCGAGLAFLLESSEFLVVTFTSSLTLSISGIFKEVCIVYLAVVWNNNKLNRMNTIGLIICLIGITIHVALKARQEAEHIQDETNKLGSKLSKRRNLISKNNSQPDRYLSMSYLNSSNNKNSKKSESILLMNQNKPLLSDSN